MTDISKCGCVAGYLFRKWGGRLAENTADPAIGTTAEELLGGDPERVSIVMMNLSANDVYISPRSEVSSTAGIRLPANGGSVTLDVDEDGVLVSRQWYAVATGAASQMFVVTTRRVTSAEQEEVHGYEAFSP